MNGLNQHIVNQTPDQQLTQLVTQGYFLTQISDLIARLPLDINRIEYVEQADSTLIPVNDDDIAEQLKPLQHEIGDRLLRPIFGGYQAGRILFWDRVSDDSAVWHNDHIEGYNLFALVYFDTMLPGVGGHVYVRNPQGEEYCHLPQRGNCLVVNMKQGYDHRAEQTRPRTATRRVANFRYNVRLLG